VKSTENIGGQTKVSVVTEANDRERRRARGEV
jgi:hypothetical protein